MNFFEKLRLGRKLALGFGFVILLAAMIAAGSARSLLNLRGDINALMQDRVTTINVLNRMANNSNVISRALRNLLLIKDEALLQAELKRMDETRANNVEARKQLQTLLKDDRSLDLFKTLETARQPYSEAINRTQKLALEHKTEEATTVLLTDLRTAQQTFFKATDDLVANEQRMMEETGNQAREEADHAVWRLAVLSLCALLFGSFIAWVITRAVMTQVGGEPADVVRVANEIADGELGRVIQRRAGDTTSILAAMAIMRERLADVVAQVHASSESVATGSAQIATGNADLSQRTEEQAASLQQTAASMEQLTDRVRLNSETASEAHRVAVGASQAAIKGGESVDQVVQTMHQITESSRRIGEIIGVIDGIAFQTNILALNAAVEAARAGEQGRGFAVVASEVRALAQRSASAAREIKSLINQSIERVDLGAQQADNSGAAMQSIVDQVRRVSELIGEISAASTEQVTTIHQVGLAVGQLDSVTQQNAALVEEGAAAAESLRAQASRLAQVVSVFKLGDRR